MIGNTAFLAALLLFVAAMVTLEQLAFLAPYKRVILHDHLPVIAAFVLVLYGNLVAGIYLVARTLFLKDTGRKLAHIDKQLLTRDTVVGDLSDRLLQEE